jgi:protein phosphatase
LPIDTLPCHRHTDAGPFDIIGDVHGCADELEELLERLGYRPDTAGPWRHPAARTVVFLGDLVDRGPRIVDTLHTVRRMVEAGTALCVAGNHEVKLRQRLAGADIPIAHGLDRSLAELDAASAEVRDELRGFLDGLGSHYVLDGGRLVVAHAGLREDLQGRDSAEVLEFATVAETVGYAVTEAFPVPFAWVADYAGRAAVVYGHTPVLAPLWVNGTINIDTGCVLGGRLTALRWPERELVAIPARRQYAVRARPMRDERSSRVPNPA